MCVYNQIIAASGVAQAALVGQTVVTKIWGIPVSDFSHLVVAGCAVGTLLIGLAAFIMREMRERKKK